MCHLYLQIGCQYDASLINVISEVRLPVGNEVIDFAVDPLMTAMSSYNGLTGAVLQKGRPAGGDTRALSLGTRGMDYLTHWVVRLVRMWAAMADVQRDLYLLSQAIQSINSA